MERKGDIVNMKKIFVGIVLICCNTFAGASIDTITKILSTSSFMWYQYWSISNIFALILFLVFLIFNGGIKKHLILEKRSNYLIPVLRGILFIPIPILIFFSLRYLPLNIYTSILITMPFFIFIFSKILQKEKINFIHWLIILLGFIGALLVIKPDLNAINVYMILIFAMPILGGILNVIVSKYSDKATALGYSFYFFFPLTLISTILFLFDPIIPSNRELLLLFFSGLFFIIITITWTAAFHIAGKHSSIISPFIYTQIVWASIFGGIFFGESLDIIAIFGLILIIASGTITIIFTPKKIN